MIGPGRSERAVLLVGPSLATPFPLPNTVMRRRAEAPTRLQLQQRSPLFGPVLKTGRNIESRRSPVKRIIRKVSVSLCGTWCYWVLPGLGGPWPATGGAAARADALDSGGRFVRLEAGAAGKLQKSATDCSIGQILDAAASATDQIVAGFVRPRDLIEDRPRARLAAADDAAPREKGQRAVDRGAGKTTPLPLQAKPERLGIKVSWRLGDRLEHVPPRDGRP